MGTNFDTILDHRLSQQEIVKLDELLHNDWKIPLSPLATVPLMPKETEWHWDLLPDSLSPENEFKTHGFLRFDAPVDLHGTAFMHALGIGSAIRWGTFLHDKATQNILIRATRHISKLVKGRTIIYLPDSISSGSSFDLLQEGKNIEDTLEDLS